MIAGCSRGLGGGTDARRTLRKISNSRRSAIGGSAGGKLSPSGFARLVPGPASIPDHWTFRRNRRPSRRRAPAARAFRSAAAQLTMRSAPHRRRSTSRSELRAKALMSAAVGRRPTVDCCSLLPLYAIQLAGGNPLRSPLQRPLGPQRGRSDWTSACEHGDAPAACRSELRASQR